MRVVDIDNLDWKDLAILHVIARSWSNPEDATVVEFNAAFPHLSHLLEQERHWRERSDSESDKA